jgi:DNA ligase D-like protein (predicted 3'-phosphoesterase)
MLVVPGPLETASLMIFKYSKLTFVNTTLYSNTTNNCCQEYFRFFDLINHTSPSIDNYASKLIIFYSNIMPKENLEKYRQKRDFSKTSEPDSKGESSKSGNIFVVQEHHAGHLHYDFRLEMDGVLKSWAVPKGPSLNPADKRLAIPTEDHPLEYAGFEGEIPAGEYGGGQIYIWDKGTYKNLKKDNIMECYKQGKIEIELLGSKLKGNFVLMKMKGKEMWLLIKMKN